MLARALAAAGVAVQRFHYRGSDNSDGETRRLTFHSMLADTQSIAACIEASSGTGFPGELGGNLRDLLLLQIDRVTTLSEGYQAAIASLRSKRLRVEWR